MITGKELPMIQQTTPTEQASAKRLSPQEALVSLLIASARADGSVSAHEAKTQPDTTVCDAGVSVSLRPSGDVRARAEDAEMRVAIDRAAEHVRDAVEREVSRLQAAPRAPHAAEAEPDALELVLDGNQISQRQREWLERPENYLRPIRIREYWRPPGVEDDEVPQELELALAAPR